MKHTPKENQSKNIQNFKTRTVPYALRYRASQIIAPYITEHKKSNTRAQQLWKYEEITPRLIRISYHTYKYHKPVNWHISEDSEPVKKFPRNPLPNNKTK